MKLSLNWLSDYVTLPKEVTPQDLAYQLTMCTVEVEGVEELAHQFDKMVVGEIKAIEQHPNADKLKIAKTDLGGDHLADIVCGGSNLSEGMFVAVAQSGAKVRWHGEGELIGLTPATIRGVKSEGMICASNEIGLAHLFPMNDDKEIVDLSAVHQETPLTPGLSLAKALRLDDVILEIDNKSLTNRPDLWGHYGMARELAAIYELELRPATVACELPAKDSKLLKVQIAEPASSERYIGVTFSCDGGLKAPFWMRSRLALMGQRSINLPVDLTNYVLFSIGQPMHVFDREKLHGSSLSVRKANAGEIIRLLDEEQYELSEHDLIIADEAGPVALAGVMGGLDSSVTDSTTEILLESANFEPTGVRKSGFRYGLRTESSMRFEKGLDTVRPKEGVSLYLALLQELTSSVQITSAHDCYPKPPEPISVSVTRDFINSRIGRALSVADIRSKLERLSFHVEESNGSFHLVVPHWRATGDISIAEDIVEEVARLYGYDNIEFVAPKTELTNAVFQPKRDRLREVRRYLSSSAGMHEVITYPWVEEQFLKAAGFTEEQCVTLHGAPSPTTRCLQPSLVPNLLFGIRQNRRYFESFSLFEIAKIFSPTRVSDLSGAGEKLPYQQKNVAGVCVRSTAQEALFAAKGIAQGLLKHLSFESPVIAPSRGEQLPFSQPGALLEVRADSDGEILGWVTLVSGGALLKSQIKNCHVGTFELNLELLLQLEPESRAYKALPQYPLVDYELSVLIDRNTPWQQMEQIVSSASPLMKQIEFLSEYEGAQVPSGKKSLSFRFTLGDDSGTLSTETVNEVATTVLTQLNQTLGAELRGASS